MKTVLFACLILLFTACRNSTKDPVPKDADLNNITWKQYDDWCGNHNVISDRNFVKVSGKTIRWTGKIYKITPDRSVKKSREFTGKIIKVKMKGSKSLMSDITLRVPKEIKGQMDVLREKDTIQFEGTLSHLGGLGDHVIAITSVKKVRPGK